VKDDVFSPQIYSMNEMFLDIESDRQFNNYSDIMVFSLLHAPLAYLAYD
jgi:hypothetical protein